MLRGVEFIWNVFILTVACNNIINMAGIEMERLIDLGLRSVRPFVHDSFIIDFEWSQLSIFLLSCASAWYWVLVLDPKSSSKLQSLSNWMAIATK